MDDIFLLVSKHANIPNLISWFNNLHENLKFTHEIEINKTLNFLDVLVLKRGNRFSTRVFRKGVHPLKLMRWDSEIAIKFKRNLLNIEPLKLVLEIF